MVIADTNIIIAAIRGNEMAKQLLLKYMPAVYISVVTEIELFTGATNISKKRTVEQIIKTHETILINHSISQTALRLVKNYNTTSKSLYLPDALIAATCLHKGFSLLTFNTSDFKFIKGLHIAR